MLGRGSEKYGKRDEGGAYIDAIRLRTKAGYACIDTYGGRCGGLGQPCMRTGERPRRLHFQSLIELPWLQLTPVDRRLEFFQITISHSP